VTYSIGRDLVQQLAFSTLTRADARRSQPMSPTWSCMLPSASFLETDASETGTETPSPEVPTSAAATAVRAPVDRATGDMIGAHRQRRGVHGLTIGVAVAPASSCPRASPLLSAQFRPVSASHRTDPRPPSGA
jgi:hypothetical protein